MFSTTFSLVLTIEFILGCFNNRKETKNWGEKSTPTIAKMQAYGLPEQLNFLMLPTKRKRNKQQSLYIRKSGEC